MQESLASNPKPNAPKADIIAIVKCPQTIWLPGKIQKVSARDDTTKRKDNYEKTTGPLMRLLNFDPLFFAG